MKCPEAAGVGFSPPIPEVYQADIEKGRMDGIRG